MAASGGARAARWVRPAAWIWGLAPLANLFVAAFTDGLGADPIEEVTLQTGFAALLMLMCTLAVTPARRLTGWNALAPARRTFGLCAFLYVCLHFSTYLVDQGFALGYIVEDVAERPYVTAGFTAFLLLIPLAVTSTKGWIRRLGKRWQKLHRIVYLAAGLGVVHFLWLVKKDLREPLIFAAVFALLMALRIPGLLRGAGKRPAKPPRQPAAHPRSRSGKGTGTRVRGTKVRTRHPVLGTRYLGLGTAVTETGATHAPYGGARALRPSFQEWKV